MPGTELIPSPNLTIACRGDKSFHWTHFHRWENEGTAPWSNLPNFKFSAWRKEKKKVAEISYKDKEKLILDGEMLTWKRVNEGENISCQKRWEKSRGSGGIHRTGRSITSWSRCFQNSPQRHYIRRQREKEREREREKPQVRSMWQLRVGIATRVCSSLPGAGPPCMVTQSSPGWHPGLPVPTFPNQQAPGPLGSPAARLLICDGKWKPQPVNRTRSQTER